MEVIPYHVHLLLGCDPQFGIPRLVNSIKGISSRYLRQEFRQLKRRQPSLSTNSYFVRTVGCDSGNAQTLRGRTKEPMRKAFKYRLYPRKQQECTLFWTLARCRELYNAALSERRDAYHMAGKS